VNSVLVLHKCGRCGQAAIPFDLELRGEQVASGWSCKECLQKTQNELESVKPVFEAMLSCGVTRDVANDVMTYLLERHNPT